MEAAMKNILSVSVDSSSRDHTTCHNFLGQECEISRQDTNRDLNKAGDGNGVKGLLEKPQFETTKDDFADLINHILMEPNIEVFN